MTELDFDKELERLKKIEPGPWKYESLDSRIENADGDRQGLWWSEQEDYFVCRVRTNYPEALRRLKRLREIIEVGGVCYEGWNEIRSLLNLERKDA